MVVVVAVIVVCVAVVVVDVAVVVVMKRAFLFNYLRGGR